MRQRESIPPDRTTRQPRKLTDEQVRMVRDSNKPLAELAKELGVSKSLISLIQNRKRRELVQDD